MKQIISARELIDCIFRDFSEDERHKIHIQSAGNFYPYETKAYAWMPELYYEASVKLCFNDTFDEITGMSLALVKLREYIVNNRFTIAKHQVQNKPWIPKPGKTYYTISANGGHYKVYPQQWCEPPSQTNILDLEQEIVFKSQEAAEKYIRTKEQVSRQKINSWKKAEHKIRRNVYDS